MQRFKQIDDGQAIIKVGNVYKQVDLFSRGGGVYAKAGGGFVRLHAHGYTSVPRIKWLELDGAEQRGDEVVVC